MDYHTFTLPNGIRVIHKESSRAVSHCGLIINAGSRDEKGHQQGLAHFMEHCIFKGTVKRKTYHILSRLDNVGAEINAYTTKEETLVYASFLPEHFERAIELISDITFNSTFPEKEVLKEKEVIIDEINSYLDSPGEQIFDDFEEQIFEGHPIGRNVLGTEESVSKLTLEDVKDMRNRRYRCEEMVFSSVGSISIKKLKRLCEKYLGNYSNPSGKEERKPFSNYIPRHCELKRSVHQMHYILGNVAHNDDINWRTGMVLLNNYLGGPAMNSKLNLEIREKHGIAYNIESNYQPYSDTGVFQIYLGTDEKLFAKSEKLVHKELSALRNVPLGVSKLRIAKQQLIGQIALAQDSGVGTMIALGKSFLLYDRVDTIGEVIQKIEKVKASDLMEIANEVFNPDQLSSIAYRS